MSEIRHNILTDVYTLVHEGKMLQVVSQHKKTVENSLDGVKIRKEKILAYIEVREFSLIRNFGSR
jgi:hypothetical protein